MAANPGSADHKSPAFPPNAQTLKRSADPEAGAGAVSPAPPPEATAKGQYSDVHCVGPVCRIPL